MRIKTGTTRRKRHKKVLRRTRGMRMTKGRLYRVSKEADLHAGQYAYSGRKRRKRDLRRLWIQRINAALNVHTDGLSYSRFMNLVRVAKITINRKMMAELAVNDLDAFKSIVETAARTK